MTINQKQIAMTEFNLNIHRKNGQEFEDYFIDIMKHGNPDFLPVKAHGRIGDKKNDGYDRKKGEYFQVFAPFEIGKDRTIYNVVNKLNADFQGLLDNWDDSCPIKIYNFVINDKYKGVPPSIHEAINKLDRDYKEIEVKLFMSHDLQEVFRGLSDEHIYDFVRYIPDEEIVLEYSALNKIVKYINENFTLPKYNNTKLIAPDFLEKIKFNGLNSAVQDYLQVASYQTGSLETYFESDNRYLQKEFQEFFNARYEESRNEISESTDDYPNLRFFYILERIAPNSSKPVNDAIMVLMSYYFESCDIFEQPEKETKI